jgi:hypothetical protein
MNGRLHRSGVARLLDLHYRQSAKFKTIVPIVANVSWCHGAAWSAGEVGLVERSLQGLQVRVRGETRSGDCDDAVPIGQRRETAQGGLPAPR